jgi:hypothetical protein
LSAASPIAKKMKIKSGATANAQSALAFEQRFDHAHRPERLDDSTELVEV